MRTSRNSAWEAGERGPASADGALGNCGATGFVEGAHGCLAGLERTERENRAAGVAEAGVDGGVKVDSVTSVSAAPTASKASLAEEAAIPVALTNHQLSSERPTLSAPPATEIFTRLIACKGEAAYRELSSSSVLVLGVGAVGGFALETIARCGVGKITLVDFDVIETSNINRQIVATVPAIGRRKVDVARERVEAINPHCVVHTFCEKVDGASFAEICRREEPDVVIEAIDMFHQKGEVIAHCLREGIPIVSSMGAARKTDPSLIRLGGLGEARVCPLAHKVAQKLRQLGVDPEGPAGGRTRAVCVYSSEKPQPHPKDSEGRKLSLPSFSVITSMFGVWAAHAAIGYLIEKRFPLPARAE